MLAAVVLSDVFSVVVVRVECEDDGDRPRTFPRGPDTYRVNPPWRNHDSRTRSPRCAPRCERPRGDACEPLLIGYARVSTSEHDLTAQRVALERLGVLPTNTRTDHGLTGTNRCRPGLREALASCRDGDILVIAKLDRAARSLRDAKDIVDERTAKNVRLIIGGSVHDLNDPVVGCCPPSSRWWLSSAQT